MSTPADIVVISGGGIHGLDALGVLHYFDHIYRLHTNVAGQTGQAGQTNQTKRTLPRVFAGTSIGSVLVVLLALGIEPYHILQMLVDSGVLQSISFDYTTILKGYGLLNIRQTFEDLLTNIILTHTTYDHIPTIDEIYADRGIYLVIPVFNISQMKAYYLQPNSPYSSLTVIEAVCASCNLPILFGTFELKGELWADGALFDSFPILTAVKVWKILQMSGEDENLTPCSLFIDITENRFEVQPASTVSFMDYYNRVMEAANHFIDQLLIADKTSCLQKDGVDYFKITSENHLTEMKLTTAKIHQTFFHGFRQALRLSVNRQSLDT